MSDTFLPVPIFYDTMPKVSHSGAYRRWGVVSFADSLDCVGVLARNVRTVRKVYGKTESLSSSTMNAQFE